MLCSSKGRGHTGKARVRVRSVAATDPVATSVMIVKLRGAVVLCTIGRARDTANALFEVTSQRFDHLAPAALNRKEEILQAIVEETVQILAGSGDAGPVSQASWNGLALIVLQGFGVPDAESYVGWSDPIDQAHVEMLAEWNRLRLLHERRIEYELDGQDHDVRRLDDLIAPKSAELLDRPRRGRA